MTSINRDRPVWVGFIAPVVQQTANRFIKKDDFDSDSAETYLPNYDEKLPFLLVSMSHTV